MKRILRKTPTGAWVLLGVLVFVIVIVGVLFWLARQSPVQETETIPVLRPEARVDPLLAIKKLGETYDIEFSTVNPFVFGDGPPRTDTVFLSAPQKLIRDERASAKLEDWVTRGGNLFVEVDNLNTNSESPDLSQRANYFPSNLGVRRHHERDSESGSTIPPEIAAIMRRVTMKTEPNCSDSVGTVHLDMGLSLKIDSTAAEGFRFDTRQSSVAHAIKPLSAANLLHLRVGSGNVYFANSFRMWKNDTVMCADHALLFLALVHRTPNILQQDLTPRTVWIIQSYPKLATLIWLNAWQTIVGCIVAFLIAIVAWSMRTAPPIFSVATKHKHILEYVKSSAQFAWHNKQLEKHVRALDRIAADPERSFKPKGTVHGLEKLADRESPLANKEYDELNPRNRATLISVVRKLQQQLRQNLFPLSNTTR